MGQSANSLTGCFQDATNLKTLLANAVYHLFNNSLTPNVATPLDEFTAAECVFSGYAAKTIATWNGPVLASGSGYMITAGQLLWIVTLADPQLIDIAKGCYLVTAGGVLRGYIVFDTPVNMQVVGAPCLVDPIQVSPTNLVTSIPAPPAVEP